MSQLTGKSLSPNQAKVCQALITSPEKTAIIAYKIGMNLKTFEAHRRVAFLKLGVRSRYELFLKLLESPKLEITSIEINPFLRMINKKLDLLLMILNPNGAEVNE